MAPPIPALLFALLLLIGMPLLLEAGRRFGVSRRPKESEGERSNLGPVEGAIFALFGLLIAFTFSGAVTRFAEKRMLIAEEVNSIDVAYMRVYLVSPGARPELQQLLREYVDSRLETYRRLPDMKAAEAEMSRSKELQEEIWKKAVDTTQTKDAHPDAGKLLLPALNNMIDMATTRTMALQSHPPGIIYAVLFGLALICSLLAGYRTAVGNHRSWLHIFGFTVSVVIMAYLILDIEYPRAGLIRLETADQLLVKLRQSMR